MVVVRSSCGELSSLEGGWTASANSMHNPTQTSRDEARAQQDDGGKRRSMDQLKWFTVVVALFFAVFLFALDTTVVADVQPSIIETLGDIERLPWVSVAYPLGTIAVNLTVSKLFTLYDNKWLFIAGVLLFEIGSAVCGAAPTMDALIAGRVVCGVGGIGLYVGTMNLLSVFTTEAERPVYIGSMGLIWGAGTVLGPVVGGSFADSSATWRWAFYINLCVGVLVVPVYIFLLPSHNPRQGPTVLERLSDIDWAGSLVHTGALATLITAISLGGGVFEWSSREIIAMLSTSGVLWVLFVVQQWLALFTTKKRRLFPVRYIEDWEMCILFAQVASASVVMMVPLYFIPLFFQFVRGDSALDAGVRLLPIVFSLVFGMVFSGAMMGKLGYYMPFYVVGGIFSVVGGALLHTVGISASAGTVYGYSVIAGLGAGLYLQASYPVAQLKVSKREIPEAVAFIGYGQIAGITLALAISGSVFLSKTTSTIGALMPELSRDAVQQAIVGTKGAAFEAIDPALREAVLHAIVSVMGDIYGMVIAAGSLTVVLSVFMKREKLWANDDRNDLTGVPVERKEGDHACHMEEIERS